MRAEPKVMAALCGLFLPPSLLGETSYLVVAASSPSATSIAVRSKTLAPRVQNELVFQGRESKFGSAPASAMAALW
jgi:hypothetical protein